jgi:hypothetical protein
MRFTGAGELADEALPSVMRKVVAHALPHLAAPAGKVGEKKQPASSRRAGKPGSEEK